MKFFDLKSKLNSGELSPVYVIYGNDYFLINRAVEMFKERFLTEESLNFNFFDGTKMTADELSLLSLSVSSFPFMSEKRIVLVKDLSITEKEYNKYLKPYIDSPSNTTILLFTESEDFTAKKFDIKKVRGVEKIDCNRGDEKIVSKWIYTEFKRENIEVDLEVIRRICSYTLCSMTRIVKETEKLIDYAKGGGIIDLQAVEELVAKDSEFQLYELSNELAKGSMEKALLIVEQLKIKGFNEHLLLIRIYTFFRSLFHISISNKNDAQLAMSLKVKEYAVKMMRISAANFTKKNLRLIVSGLSEADILVKSGKLTVSGALFLAMNDIFVKKQNKA